METKPVFLNPHTKIPDCPKILNSVPAKELTIKNDGENRRSSFQTQPPANQLLGKVLQSIQCQLNSTQNKTGVEIKVGETYSAIIGMDENTTLENIKVQKIVIFNHFTYAIDERGRSYTVDSLRPLITRGKDVDNSVNNYPVIFFRNQ